MSKNVLLAIGIALVGLVAVIGLSVGKNFLFNRGISAPTTENPVTGVRETTPSEVVTSPVPSPSASNPISEGDTDSQLTHDLSTLDNQVTAIDQDQVNINQGLNQTAPNLTE